MKPRLLRDVHAEVIIPLTRQQDEAFASGGRKAKKAVDGFNQGVLEACCRFGFTSSSDLPELDVFKLLDFASKPRDLQHCIEFAKQSIGVDLRTCSVEDISIFDGSRLLGFTIFYAFIRDNNLSPVILN